MDYDKENRRLIIPHNEFVGMHITSEGVKRNIKKGDKAEYKETILGIEKEDSDMSGEITDQA